MLNSTRNRPPGLPSNLPEAIDLPRRSKYGPPALGRSQVVRQRILIPPFPGSNPGAPAMNSLFLHIFLTNRKKASNTGLAQAVTLSLYHKTGMGAGISASVSDADFGRLVFRIGSLRRAELLPL